MKPAKLERAMISSWVILIGGIIMIAAAFLIRYTQEPLELEDLGYSIYILIGMTWIVLSVVFSMLYTLHTQIKQT
jgi:hypothetical protein